MNQSGCHCCEHAIIFDVECRVQTGEEVEVRTVSIISRISKLEEHWGSPAENEKEVLAWAETFASMRTRLRATGSKTVLERDISTARYFVYECRRRGEPPAIFMLAPIFSPGRPPPNG